MDEGIERWMALRKIALGLDVIQSMVMTFLYESD